MHVYGGGQGGSCDIGAHCGVSEASVHEERGGSGVEESG